MGGALAVTGTGRQPIRRAGLAGDSLFQPSDLERLMKPLLCMHVGPEVSRYDDVMLCMYREVWHAARRRRRSR